MNIQQASVLLEFGRLTKREAGEVFIEAERIAQEPRGVTPRQAAAGREMARRIWRAINDLPEALVPTPDRRVEEAALSVAVGALVELEEIVERRGDHTLGQELAAAGRVVERIRGRFAAASAAQPRQAAPAGGATSAR